MPLLRGTQSHLCRLPTYQSTPSDGMSSGMAPGACAPSASTATPRPRSAAAISASGRPGRSARRCDRQPRVESWGRSRQRTRRQLPGPTRPDRASRRYARRPLLARGKRRRARHPAVPGVRDHELVAGGEVERPQDGVRACRRVVHECQIVAGNAEKLPDDVGRLAQPRPAAARHPDDDLSELAEKVAARVALDASRIARCASSTRCGVTPTVP